MSDTSVHTILSAITEAKSALDREPEYKSRIAQLESSLSESQRHAQALELSCLDYRSMIEHLNDKVRSLEVERDDASFRLLEAEDKLLAYANLCEVFSSNAKRLAPIEQVPEPVKPTIVEPSFTSFNEVKEAASVGSSFEPDWMDKDGNVGHNQVVPMQPPHPLEVVGQSEANPTQSPAQAPVPEMTSQLASASTLGADSGMSVASSTTSDKPYSGKTYSEVFGNGSGCALEDWQKGGGSDELYWR